MLNNLNLLIMKNLLFVAMVLLIGFTSCTKEDLTEDITISNNDNLKSLNVEITTKNEEFISCLYIINNGGINWENNNTYLRYNVNCTINDDVRIKLLKDCEHHTKYDIHIWNNDIDVLLKDIDYYDKVFTIE